MAYDLAGLAKQAVALLKQKPGLGLVAVAEAVGAERHTVERAFQLSVRMSFRDFRRELLCRKTVELFGLNPGASISETAFALGYQWERAFARFVRNSFGCTPSDLRRRLRGGGQACTHGPAQYASPRGIAGWQEGRLMSF
jgi:AraC-like DNA-binding protein